MNRSVQRQDRGGAQPLGLFRNGEKVGTVPPDDVYDRRSRAEAAARLDCAETDIEVLTVCPDHPNASAVDCPDHAEDEEL